MDDKFMYIPIENNRKYPFCRFLSLFLYQKYYPKNVEFIKTLGTNIIYRPLAPPSLKSISQRNTLKWEEKNLRKKIYNNCIASNINAFTNPKIFYNINGFRPSFASPRG